jgi:hypothetical protein
MLDGIDGMIPHHAGTGKAHHSTHPFPHVFFIAMYGTLSTSLLLFTELATVQSGMGIFKQGTTIGTKLTVAFLQPAIQPYHLFYCFLFFCYSRHGHLFSDDKNRKKSHLNDNLFPNSQRIYLPLPKNQNIL